MEDSGAIEIQKITNQADLERAWALRKQVFVVEQACPEELEWEYEEESIHFMALHADEVVGTARWRRTEKGIKLERFAVDNRFRKKGIGSALVKAVLEDLPEQSVEIYLHAQIQAAGLYAANGFIEVGEHFDEAGIEHVKMVYRKVDSF